jgi:phosphoribosylformylglycinamidine (FGAM) synthase-like amidotransferase family enzyme
VEFAYGDYLRTGAIASFAGYGVGAEFADGAGW